MHIPGIHHVTAIAGGPQRNLDFYTKALGLRLIKRTVNFEDIVSYHFYFGDARGTPGTVVTFFAWPDGRRRPPGAGQATAMALTAPAGSLDAWAARLRAHGAVPAEVAERFGDRVLGFADPDGLRLELVAEAGAAMGGAAAGEAGARDRVAVGGGAAETAAGGTGAGSAAVGSVAGGALGTQPGAGAPTAPGAATRVAGVTLAVADWEPTARLLTETMGLTADGADGGRRRFRCADGGWVDVVQVAGGGARGPDSVGNVQHVAFRTRDDDEQAAWRERLLGLGFHVSPVRDRSYFHSIYFREPGGVLFEIATDGPGFAVDEPADALGTALRLPPWLEARRAEIEAVLPAVEAG